MDEVAKHNTAQDCWLAVNGNVLDMTKLMHDLPCGVQPFLIFAGKDVTEEFNTIHPPGIIEKYAPQAVIGKLLSA